MKKPQEKRSMEELKQSVQYWDNISNMWFTSMLIGVAGGYVIIIIAVLCALYFNS